MPGCAATDCSNSAKKGFLMKHFPKDPLRRKEWCIQMKRDNWNPTDYSCLCEVHFAPEMWEKTRADGKRALKCTAIPTIFSISKPKKVRKAPKLREPNSPRKSEMVETRNVDVQVKTSACSSEVHSSNFDAVFVKVERESDDEMVETTPDLIQEPKAELPPVVEKFSNDEEFECNMDVDVAKVLAEQVKLSPPVIKLNLDEEIKDIRTQRDLPGICDLCQETDDHVELLLEHFRSQHNLKDGNYVCPFCDYTSPKHEVVMKHTTKVHKLSSAKLSCDHCEFQTFRGDLFNCHSSKHLQEKIDYKTASLNNLKMHSRYKHTKENEFKCQFCEFKSLSHASGKRHKSSKHAKERVLKCEKCPFATPLAHSLKRHCKNRNRRKYNYECEECTFKTDNLTGFNNHNLISHPKKEILFCNICEFETTELGELTDHAEIHLKSEPIDED